MANDPREGGVESMFNERKEEWSSKVGVWEGVGWRWHMNKFGQLIDASFRSIFST